MNKQTKNIIIRLVVLLLVIGFFTVSLIARASVNNFKVADISILIDELEDNFMISKDDVYYLITKNFSLKNQAINNKTLFDIEQMVDTISCVESTQAFIDKNKKLCVSIKQRTPIARVYNQLGQNFYIDRFGIKFMPKQNGTIKVPIITGVITETLGGNDTIKQKSLIETLKVCQFLKQENTWYSLIGQININEKKEIELIPRIGNALILLGNSNDLEEKFNKLNVFYTEVLDKVGWEKYRVINIMYKDQAICLK